MSETSILILDDDPDVLDALKVLLEDEFTTIVTESNASRFENQLGIQYDIIMLDMNFSAGINTGNEGLFWLSRIKEKFPNASVITMTAYGNIDLAVEAIKKGAKDFILKPWDNVKLVATLKAIVSQRKYLSKKQTLDMPKRFIGGHSKAMSILLDQLNKIAPTDASILLLGENGVGKEMIAREIHRLSTRTGRGFYAIDISTISPQLFESELFGHKKGAFTDARIDRKGKIEEANGGTLFLDEIGNLQPQQQAKLLTVLQNKEVTPIGTNERTAINVRLITATNAPLLSLVDQGIFRQDLLYRINTITLTIPPLRERGEDILLLAGYFIEMYGMRYHKPGIRLSAEADKLLLHYHWPGNVRELQHTIEKALILCTSVIIEAIDLDLSISSKPGRAMSSKTLDQMEKEAIQKSLEEHGGNIVQASKTLGITRQTLYNKMRKYGI